MRTYKSTCKKTCKSLQVLQEMERNMKIFYLFTSIVLTLFVISCKTVKDTSQEHLSVVDIDLSRISYSDSLHQELAKQILKLEFDSLKVSMPAQDEKPAVTATIYGGKLDSQKESAVIDSTCKVSTDSLESYVDTEESVIKEVEQVAVGEPPNLFFLYLIIIIALLFFIYIKFIR